MSPQTHPKLNAQISEEAAEWLVEFRSGDMTAASRAAFDAWVRTSPEHLRAYLEVAAIWNEGSALDAAHRLDMEALTARARAESSVARLESTGQFADRAAPNTPVSGEGGATNAIGRRPFARPFAWAASLAAVALIGGSLAWQHFYRGLYVTAPGEERQLVLADGSTIKMNSRSRLRVHFEPTERSIDLLEGQALFHVAKDASRPFIVASGTTRVRAVGTEFDVDRRLEATIVTVLEGHIAVTSSDYDTPAMSSQPQSDQQIRALDGAASTAQNLVYLSAGEQVTVTHAAPPKPERANLSAATAWTQHQLLLESVPLTEVAEEFNRYSRRELVVEDSSTHPLRLSGVFATDPDFLLRYLRARSDIQIEETSSQIHIRRLP